MRRLEQRDLSGLTVALKTPVAIDVSEAGVGQVRAGQVGAEQVGAGQVGDALPALGEDAWFDRKSACTRPVALAPAISGMANAEGGLVVMGVHDDAVEGLTAAGDGDGWRQVNLEFVEPLTSVRIHKVACRTATGPHDHLLVLDVGPSKRPQNANSDEVHLRVGDETKKLTFEQRLERG